VIQLLKPFEQLTLEMSSDTATLSMIIPSVQMLTHNINQVNVYSNKGIKTLKHDLLTALDKIIQTIMKGDLHVVSTFLDPRFKSLLSDSQVLQVHKKCMQHQATKTYFFASKKFIDSSVFDIKFESAIGIPLGRQVFEIPLLYIARPVNIYNFCVASTHFLSENLDVPGS
jgi:hypothetical protein